MSPPLAPLPSLSPSPGFGLRRPSPIASPPPASGGGGARSPISSLPQQQQLQQQQFLQQQRGSPVRVLSPSPGIGVGGPHRHSPIPQQQQRNGSPISPLPPAGAASRPLSPISSIVPASSLLRRTVQIGVNWAPTVLLGRGSFGSVFKARVLPRGSDAIAAANARDNKTLAGQLAHASSSPPHYIVIKSVAYAHLTGRTRELTLNEAAATLKAKHPNIVRAYDAWIENSASSASNKDAFSGNICIALEYCSGGNVSDLVKYASQHLETRVLTNDVICKIGFSIASALEYLHANKIIHRDIKPENVLMRHAVLVVAATDSSSSFSRSGSPIAASAAAEQRSSSVSSQSSSNNNKETRVLSTDANRFCAVVSDLGIARILDNTAGVAKTKIGTPLYSAPEQLTGQQYSSSIDCWALGCVLFELLTAGERPFPAKTAMHLLNMVLTLDPCPSLRDKVFSLNRRHAVTPQFQYDPALVEVVCSCLSKDPAKRPSASGIKSILSALMSNNNNNTNIINSSVNSSSANSRSSSAIQQQPAHTNNNNNNNNVAQARNPLNSNPPPLAPKHASNAVPESIERSPSSNTNNNSNSSGGAIAAGAQRAPPSPDVLSPHNRFNKQQQQQQQQSVSSERAASSASPICAPPPSPASPMGANGLGGGGPPSSAAATAAGGAASPSPLRTNNNSNNNNNNNHIGGNKSSLSPAINQDAQRQLWLRTRTTAMSRTLCDFVSNCLDSAEDGAGLKLLAKIGIDGVMRFAAHIVSRRDSSKNKTEAAAAAEAGNHAAAAEMLTPWRCRLLLLQNCDDEAEPSTRNSYLAQQQKLFARIDALYNCDEIAALANKIFFGQVVDVAAPPEY